MIALPTVIVYFALQKHFVSGLTLGATKADHRPRPDRSTAGAGSRHLRPPPRAPRAHSLAVPTSKESPCRPPPPPTPPASRRSPRVRTPRRAPRTCTPPHPRSTCAATGDFASTRARRRGGRRRVETDYDDSDWDTIDVLPPGAARRRAWGRPAYTNVKYPFPLDPPHVPDANPTGDHRRRFDLPAAWLASGRVWLRFDGRSLGRVWLNGDEVGVVPRQSAGQKLDVTNSLREENTLVVRVHQWSAMSYIEDQDQWWLPGLFREVTLLHRPDAGLD